MATVGSAQETDSTSLEWIIDLKTLNHECMGENRQDSVLNLTVVAVDASTEGVAVLELRDAAGRPLPSFEPGAHLEVYLPNDLIRHYSLCNDSTETHRYCIGVSLSPSSRGGSKYIHEQVQRGAILAVSAPRNNFHLLQGAGEYCFIAGGIGITPILPMIKWCENNGKPWRLYYCARSRQRAAFYEELRTLGEAEKNVHFHLDDEQRGGLFEPVKALRGLSPAAHVYCCGPAALMNAVAACAVAGDADRYHFEWFSARPAELASEKSFSVTIHSSGRRITIPPDRTILSVLEDHGIGVPYSCREGLCGTCETGVISGIPEHRDGVLSQAQRSASKTMMICVSRAQSDEIELDL